MAKSLQAGTSEFFPGGLKGFAGGVVGLGGEGLVAADATHFVLDDLFLPLTESGGLGPCGPVGESLRGGGGFIGGDFAVRDFVSWGLPRVLGRGLSDGLAHFLLQVTKLRVIQVTGERAGRKFSVLRFGQIEAGMGRILFCAPSYDADQPGAERHTLSDSRVGSWRSWRYSMWSR